MRGRGGYSRPPASAAGGGGGERAPAAPFVSFKFPAADRDSGVGVGVFAIASSPLAPSTVGVLRRHGRLDVAKSEWLIPCAAHATLARELQALSGPAAVQVRPLPAAALELLERGPRARPPVVLNLPAPFRSRMRDFQVDAVTFAVARGGRVLIGDEMGCGKTISAIATALHYADAWPLLILSPAGLRLNWKDELLRWVDGLRADDISIILTAKDAKDDLQRGGKRVFIVGTSIVSNLVKERSLAAGKFEIVICDESHQLKTRDSARSKAVIPLLQAAKHVILLSGTPSPNRPRELFAQISAVNRSIFGSDYVAFSTRYCFGHQAPWGWSDVGASNTEELSALLREHIMVRRLKKDVLPELRRKLRTTKVVSITDESRAELGALERELKSVVARLQAADGRAAESLRQIKQGLEMRVFKAIGVGKAPAVSFLRYMTRLPVSHANARSRTESPCTP
jgi:SNF2 family DNA or RNA helicase